MSSVVLVPFVRRWIWQVLAVGFTLGFLARSVFAGPALPLPSPLDTPIPANEIGTLQAQINACPGAGPCVITLASGAYTGDFTINAKTNLTITWDGVGRRPVITNRDARFTVANSLWTEQATPGVYRIPEVIGQTVHRFDGRRVLVAPDVATFDTFVADNLDVVRIGAGESFIYLSGANPNSTPLWISRNNNPVFNCNASPGLQLSGLDLWWGGAQTIDLENCDNPIIDEVVVLGGNVGLRTNACDSDNTIVRQSWWWNDFNDEWFYRDVKGNSQMEGAAIVACGLNPLIEENITQGWFNGIGVVSAGTTTTPTVQRNFIWKTRDDVFEFDGTVKLGTIDENFALDAFVCFSFAPRLVAVPGEVTTVVRNSVQCTYDYAGGTLFDRTLATTGSPTCTKYNGSFARDLLYDNNSFDAIAHCLRGASSGSDARPTTVDYTDNVVVSMVGPLVRFTGLDTDGADFENNLYFNETGALSAFRAWNEAPPTATNYNTLALAKASAPGVAAGWEALGVEADPLLVIPGEPSSPGAGSPVDARGAWPEGAAFAITSTTTLRTGWILRRGTGFTSNGVGLGMVNPIIGSPTWAFARALAAAGGQPGLAASKNAPRPVTVIVH